MSYLDWHVGMKVVCVEEFEHNGTEHLPLVGAIYTLRGLRRSKYTDRLYVQLVEVVNVPRQYAGEFGEPWFSVEGFRPVQTKKTDISVFQAMLTGNKQKVEA